MRHSRQAVKLGHFKSDGVQKYSADLIPLLERYLRSEQLSVQSVDLPPTLHLLKLYKLFPEKNNVSLITRLLLRVLKSLPDRHFAAALYLLLDESLREPIIRIVRSMYAHLDTARFREFWALRPEVEGLVDDDFDESVRDYIVGSLAITYRRIKLAMLLEFLDLETVPQDLVDKWGLDLQEEGFVQFQTNRFNRLTVQEPSDRKVTHRDIASILSATFQ